MSVILGCLITRIRAQAARLRELGDDGYSTETVIVTALLAIAVVAIISAKVLAKANSIGM